VVGFSFFWGLSFLFFCFFLYFSHTHDPPPFFSSSTPPDLLSASILHGRRIGLLSFGVRDHGRDTVVMDMLEATVSVLYATPPGPNDSFVGSSMAGSIGIAATECTVSAFFFDPDSRIGYDLLAGVMVAAENEAPAYIAPIAVRTPPHTVALPNLTTATVTDAAGLMRLLRLAARLRRDMRGLAALRLRFGRHAEDEGRLPESIVDVVELPGEDSGCVIFFFFFFSRVCVRVLWWFRQGLTFFRLFYSSFLPV
jgi:hypothetical protein